MSAKGFHVYPGKVTKAEVVELLKECAQALNTAQKNNLAIEFRFEGRMGELLNKAFENITHPVLGRFEDYEKACVRFWLGSKNKVTPTHYDPGNRVIWSVNLMGRKLWHFQKCGYLDTIWKCPPFLFPNQVEGPQYFPDWAMVEGGDVSILEEYTYHTVMYLEQSFTVDVETFKKAPKFRLWKHIIPAWHCGSIFPGTRSLLDDIMFYVLSCVGLMCWLARPAKIYRGYKTAGYIIGAAHDGVAKTKFCAPLLLEHAKRIA